MRSRSSLILVPLTAVILAVLVQAVSALTPPMPFTTDGKALVTASRDQSAGDIVRNGSDLFIAWQDDRNGSGSTNFDIYAQRINVFDGEASWDINGKVVSDLAGNQFSPIPLNDGSGGILVDYLHFNGGVNFDVYVQRVDGTGTRQWGSYGTGVASGTADQRNSRFVPDGAGGAIVTWMQRPGSTSSYDLYAQRVSSAGSLVWPSPTLISGATSDQQNQELIPDGSGGAIIVWNDRRQFSNWDVYAQKIASDGAVQWTSDGLALAALATSDQVNPQIVPSSGGNFFVSWLDSRTNGGNSASSRDVYAQLFDSSGTPVWGSPTVVSSSDKEQRRIQLATSDAGGMVVSWTDFRNEALSSRDVYVQKVSSAGALLWNGTGVAVSTADSLQQGQEMVADGLGGTVVVWEDDREDPALLDTDIYTQRILSSGEVLWTGNGAPVSSTGDIQALPNITDDGAEGAVVVWFDRRNKLTTGYDVYTQRIDPDIDGDLVGDNSDNCPTIYNPDQADADLEGIGDACDTPENTPTGTNVNVDLGGGSSINFGSVTATGDTVLITTSDAPAAPASGFSFLGTYYDVTTTAIYSGPLTVCFIYDPGQVSGNESDLKLFHLSPPSSWVDVTTSVDTGANEICGLVSSLSYFGVGYSSSLPSTGAGQSDWLIYLLGLMFVAAGGWLSLRLTLAR